MFSTKFVQDKGTIQKKAGGWFRFDAQNIFFFFFFFFFFF